MQIQYKSVVDFKYFRVNHFQNNKYPQKQENLNNPNNSNFPLWNCIKFYRADACVLPSTKDGDDFCNSLWNMAKTLFSS